MDVSLGQLIISNPKIVSGQKLAATIATQGLSLCGILMPAAFTGDALTFYSCSDATGTAPIQIFTKANVALSYVVAQAQYQVIDPDDFRGVQFLQIRSDENEGADRILLCSMKGI